MDTYLTGELRHARGPGSSGPSVFVLTGGAGAGKSHALREALSGTPVSRRRTAVSEISHRAPFAVASDLLGTDLGRPVPADAENRLLSRLDDLCAAGPLVLAVDDVQDADAASLAVLHLMASTAGDLPLVLLLTRRPAPEREHLTRLLHGRGVREIVLPPLDDMDLDALVHEHTRRWPTRRLRAALASHRDNPLRILALLDGLAGAGALTPAGDTLDLVPGRAAEEIADGELGTPATAAAALQGPAREIARVLAVLGRPCAVGEIASVAAMNEVSVIEPVQVLLDRGLAAFDAQGRLAFTQDGYCDAVRRGTPGPLLRVLHTAAARHEEPAGRIHHVIASGAAPADVLSAIREAEDELVNAPAVEADLLAGSSVAAGSSTASVSLAIRRARALARSGQPSRAETVARTALVHAAEPRQIIELRRAVVFALTLRGRAREALAEVEEALAAPVDARVRDILEQHRRQLTQLGGLEPLSLRPPAAEPLALTVTGLATEAVRLFLGGLPHLAVELSWEASRRHMSRSVDPYEGASSDVWPPLVELFANGPRAADAALRDMQQLREERGAVWQSAPHEMLRGSIDMHGGRLDDAAIAFDAGLELAATAELGWTSAAVAGRATIDVLRGEPDPAEARLRDWNSTPRELQFGIPAPACAEVALLEARRRHAEAARLARDVWQTAADLHLCTWLAMAAPDLARTALRAADDGLRSMIARDLARLPHPLPPALVPSVRLAQALTGAGPADREAPAVAAAEEAGRLGRALLELIAWEEAAVAAAGTGARDRAREHAGHALRCAERTGAAGVAQRVSQRLRATDVRLGKASRRSRPATGWEALTPTESQVAELVVAGRSGPDIARAMNISIRTVQSHVSRALAKLGLSSRIELAAAARTQQA
ncbi:LuxR C-terminal-related transcriptional regulator [Streptomyces sp. NPDC001288]|uniref:helix-turn-helix transcriptional regulator n=1 Tax=unclassified Streptomyces TaxID=2593676 RepID=UPI00331A15AD